MIVFYSVQYVDQKLNQESRPHVINLNTLNRDLIVTKLKILINNGLAVKGDPALVL